MTSVHTDLKYHHTDYTVMLCIHGTPISYNNDKNFMQNEKQLPFELPLVRIALQVHQIPV